MKKLLTLLAVLAFTVLPALAQFGGQMTAAGAWEPRNYSRKLGLKAEWNFGDSKTLTLNGAGISKALDRSWVAGRNENLLVQNTDLTQANWAATDATKDNATNITFTAQNGKVVQNVTTEAGVSYVFSFLANTNSGNTSLTIVHTSSATGNTTPVILTGTATTYSVTVLGKSGGGTVSFGIQDANAAGFGQIYFAAMQVRRATSSTNYVATTTVVEDASRSLLQATAAAQPTYTNSGAGLLAGRSTAYFDGSNFYLKSPGMASLVQPETVLWVGKQVTWTANDRIFDGNGSSTTATSFFQSGATPNVLLYAGSASVADNANLAVGSYGVTSVVFNGVSSSIQINATTPTTGNPGANNMYAFTLAANGVGTGLGNIQTSQVLLFDRVLTTNSLNYVRYGGMKDAGVF